MEPHVNAMIVTILINGKLKDRLPLNNYRLKTQTHFRLKSKFLETYWKKMMYKLDIKRGVIVRKHFVEKSIVNAIMQELNALIYANVNNA